MSRLIIKGLPSRYDNKHLRELFEPLGEVTDARVMKTQDGRSRRFGFVGFRTKQDAARARASMHRAFVDTAAVHVEIAHSKGDDSIPRPWSRYSSGSSRFEKANANHSDRGSFKNGDGKSDANAKRSKEIAKSAPNDDEDFTAFEQVAAPKADNLGKLERVKAAKTTQKSELIQSKKNGTKGQLVERKHVTFEEPESDAEEDNLYEELPANNSADAKDPAEIGNETALDDAVSDADYLKSKVGKQRTPKDHDNDNSANTSDASAQQIAEKEKHTNDASDANDVAESKNTAANETSASESASDSTDYERESRSQDKTKPKKMPEKDSTHIDAGETGRLMIRNLAYSVTEEELETTFERFGALSEVHVVRDGATNQSRGLAFVQYSIPENAARAMISLDGSFQSGRIMHILAAKPRPKPREQVNAYDKNAGSSSFKRLREEERKNAAKSGRDGALQNALHVSTDGVADLAASQHGVDKADLYGTTRGESGIAAVRLAVAEATVQGETRAFLLEEGIDLNVALEGNQEMRTGTSSARRKRMSRTAFLVKNLPARTTKKQVEGVFKSFGKILRLVVVPSGLLAVIEFSTASEARRAYNEVAYTRFKNVPLYLEWLPVEALRGASTGANGTGDVETVATGAVEKNIEEVVDEKTGDDEDGERNGCSVYVKNLSFETRDAQLKAHFKKVLKKRKDIVTSLRSAKVAMKHGGEGKESERLSMGFGFLEFDNAESAKEAVKTAQNSKLDGHELRLQISTQRSDAKDVVKKRKRGKEEVQTKPGPKLIVRNVAFEATRKDVRQLFASFGQLKTVRMPNKLDGSHRGYAFVEFVSKNEAVAAFNALSSTHLYGRHLVIEYAEDNGVGEVSLGDLQDKAAWQLAMNKRRRSDDVQFGEGGKSGGDKKERGENDDVAMMRDELYG